MFHNSSFHSSSFLSSFSQSSLRLAPEVIFISYALFPLPSTTSCFIIFPLLFLGFVLFFFDRLFFLLLLLLLLLLLVYSHPFLPPPSLPPSLLPSSSPHRLLKNLLASASAILRETYIIETSSLQEVGHDSRISPPPHKSFNKYNFLLISCFGKVCRVASLCCPCL